MTNVIPERVPVITADPFSLENLVAPHALHEQLHRMLYSPFEPLGPLQLMRKHTGDQKRFKGGQKGRVTTNSNF
jgi:hypothetical protein